ncbi:MAG: NUDIX domain-containing protein [Pseudomonadota bacterium]
MTSLFVFGTLRDRALLSIVAGRDLPARPATLADHGVFLVEGEDFPICIPSPGIQSEGLLLSDLTDSEMARFDFYELGFGYTRAQYDISVADTTVPAQIYLPEEDALTPSSTPWSLPNWQASYGELTREVARVAMQLMGRVTPAELAVRWPVLEARAQTRLSARSRPSPARAGVPDLAALESLETTVPYDAFFRLEEHLLRFPQFAGGLSAPVKRAALVAVDAVTVLPYDPQLDRVLLVDQFRIGAYARGDLQPWVLEPIAGRVDGGQSWEETAHREAWEEAGVRLRSLEFIGGYYPSPGVLTEYIASYVGLCDLPDAQAGIYGVAEEGEDIRAMLCSRDELLMMTRNGRIQNGPLFLSALWLEAHRDRLRGQV